MNDRINGGAMNAAGGSGYYESPAPEKKSYTARQRWLLLGTLALGAVFSWVVLGGWTFSDDFSGRGWCLRYGAFWLAYLAGFYFATWETSKSSVEGWALALAALLLILRPLVYAEQGLALSSVLAIPLLLMLHSVVSLRRFTLGREAAGAYLRGWFVSPFICLGRFFGAAGSLFKKKANASGAVWLGLLAGLPVAIVAAALLVSADAAMSYYLQDFLDSFNIGPFLLRAFFALALAALFYSFIYDSAYREAREVTPVSDSRPIRSAGALAAGSLVMAVYVVFALFQFAYLTGLAGLPAGLTYSEYAVRGFNELCAVAGLNLALFAVFSAFAEDTRPVRALLWALLAATVVILASAVARLVMYVDAYGLTLRRIVAFWFMLYLAAMLLLSMAKLVKKELKLLKLAAYTLVVFYLALSALNLDAIIAQSVLSRAEKAGELTTEDANYLRCSLSEDALPVMRESPLKAQIWYDVEESDIP